MFEFSVANEFYFFVSRKFKQVFFFGCTKLGTCLNKWNILFLRNQKFHQFSGIFDYYVAHMASGGAADFQFVELILSHKILGLLHTFKSLSF